MKTKKFVSLVLSIFVLLAVSVSAGPSLAKSLTTPDGPLSVDAVVNSRISYQGVLKSGGIPVNVPQDMVFHLYSNSSCTTSVGGDIIKDNVPVNNGLFTVPLDVLQSNFNGQALWIRVTVEGAIIACQEILPAPYALSLRPGATIAGNETSILYPALMLNSSGGDYDTGLTSVVSSSDGYAGYFWNGATDGVAVYANGKIASSKKSYLWMSGNGLQKTYHDDTTYMDTNGYAAAIIYAGADWSSGTVYVAMPVTIPGVLYGQNVELTGLDIKWISAADMMGITHIRLNRIIDSNSLVEIIVDNTDYGCEDDNFPNGCTIHLDLTTNNVLTADSGILYLAIGLNYISATDWIRIDGIRLTMEHQN